MKFESEYTKPLKEETNSFWMKKMETVKLSWESSTLYGFKYTMEYNALAHEYFSAWTLSELRWAERIVSAGNLLWPRYRATTHLTVQMDPALI